MKLRIVSDLHLDHDYTELPRMKTDHKQTLILAGDISANYKKYENFIRDVSYRFKDIVVIFGNHEYYGHPFLAAKRKITEICAEFSNVHLLDNSSITLSGKKIYGATLWTESYKNATWQLNDFNSVQSLYKDKDNYYYQEYQECVSYLEKHSQDYDIIVTHHSPSYKSLSPQFSDSNLNGYFMNHLDSLTTNKKLKLWIHGHTHDSKDYNIDKCKIICNPKGYRTENGGYNAKLTYKI